MRNHQIAILSVSKTPKNLLKEDCPTKRCGDCILFCFLFLLSFFFTVDFLTGNATAFP